MSSTARWTLLLLLALSPVLPACSTDPGSSGGRSDAGAAPGTDAGSADAGQARFPDPALTLPGATAPGLAISPGGRVTLAVQQGGRLLAYPALPSAEPVLDVSADDGDPETVLRLLASPTTEEAVVVFRSLGTYAARLRDGAVSSAPAFFLGDALQYETRDLNGTWTGEHPLVAFEADGLYAVSLGEAGGQLPGAPPTGARVAFDHGALEYNLTASLLDLGGGYALLFVPEGEAEPTTGYGSLARWVLLQRDSSRAAADGAWLSPVDTGTLALPEPNLNYAWIQVHPLHSGVAALTVAHVSPASLCYDLFLTTLSIGADRRPVLGTEWISLSDTGGDTDNSDHPLVLPAPGGRTWVAWRERNYGPRVALYDADFHRQLILAPDVELHLDDTQHIAAAVDAQGALHLAAVLRPSGTAPVVDYWVLPLPAP